MAPCTVWPAAARWTAVARPMPEFAPVTTMTAMTPSLAPPSYPRSPCWRTGPTTPWCSTPTTPRAVAWPSSSTILAGEHKGAVVSVVSPDWTGDALDLLGIPATLVVADGRPQVTFEP